jgi:hexokinase
VAIVNDTVGSLVAYAYKDQNTIASMIIGTGTNAACICETSEFKKQTFPPDFPQYMIINSEISLMGSDFLPKRTKYDIILDSQSSIPGFQPFEKMVSGRYMGELVRLAIVDYVKNCNLFDGKLPGKMEIPYNFTTIHMSEIERYNKINYVKLFVS